LKRTIAIGLSLILLLASGCARSRQTRYQAEFLSLFDTVTRIVGYSDSEEHFNAFAEQVRAKIEEYHRLYDVYNTYDGINNIKTINDNAGKAPVTVDKRIIDLLVLSKQQYSDTGGAMNVALGAVLKIWHDYREIGLNDPENAELPPMEALKEAAKHTDLNKVIVDTKASTVYLEDPLMSLDVGGIAKGYAAEQVARYFQQQGVTSLLMSLGGSVRAIGGKTDPDTKAIVPWTVGVQNPDKESAQGDLLNVSIKDLCVDSSGSYERYYTVNGVAYNHIINPVTLMPGDYFTDVTIVGPDDGLADSLNTALFVMPLDAGRRLMEKFPGYEALWVMKDGSLEYSDGFKGYIKTT
jgi:thiamine biosynthesis lipoprotein